VYDITEDGVTYRVHEYTTVGGSAFTVTDLGSTGDIEYLVVGGGGGGSAGYAGNGGGGAGGYVPGTTTLTDTGSLTVQVGAGGSGGLATAAGAGRTGTNGNSSVFGDITAYGGGYGGTGLAADGRSLGAAGGSSGGGGFWYSYGFRPSTPSAYPDQGNAGGANLCSNSGGGGGGAGGPGTPSTHNGFTATYIDPDGVQQTLVAPAGPTDPDAPGCSNPHYDSSYYRTTIDSPDTPVRVLGWMTGPGGQGGPGVVNDITGVEVEYAHGGEPRSSATIPANTGSGGHSIYACCPGPVDPSLGTTQAQPGADGTVIIRYPLTTPNPA
jgi:Predicted membrane protein